MMWKMFCFSVIIPMGMKQKIKNNIDPRNRIGTQYNIPLFIYPITSEIKSEQK